MRAIVLHNPTAGSGDVAAEDLLAALAAGGTTARYCSTEQPDFADALREPADLVVVAGGDGTVVKAIGHLPDRTLPLAILPLGGANNIARSLGMITADPLSLARTGWRDTPARRLDIGTAAGPWGERLFVEAVGVGVLAEAAATMDGRNLPGCEKSRAARAALLELLAGARAERLTLTIDGHEIEPSCLLAEIMNTASIGPRLALAPAADPGDGLLDLVYLEPDARTAMLAWLESSSERPPPLTTRRGRVFAFEWRRGRLHVGDTFHAPSEAPCMVQVALQPDPVTVLVPGAMS